MPTAAQGCNNPASAKKTAKTLMISTPTPEFEFCQGQKSDKKAIKRFYRQHSYSAGFMGLDSCYLVKDKQQIIACVIHSRLVVENQQSLLHALVVAPGYRRQAIASSLLDYSCAFHPLTVCFADKQLAPLYLSSRFTPASQHQLFPELAARYTQYIKKKPELTIFMRDSRNG
ncbi:GNAT family N-acetyltransferase [Thalassomonas viridans]|uniref:GNAT family N-acetyltransferase n=1 Tax=Thalassomonas viridans TaxID=137584 RepID=A0AAF0C7M7_9GAMM|nr:GNAT family N-acetyltransferase [Thalassomonas viridans]WDE03330.1 GNAT family N-acetyltransferase [Thalassomonas viridans]